MDKSSLAAAISGFTELVKTTTATSVEAVKDNIKKLPMPVYGGTLNNASEIAIWLENEKFSNLMDLRVMCPNGLTRTYNLYLDDLEHTWMVVRNIEEELLTPLAKMLAGMAQKPEELTYPTGQKLLNIRAPLLKLNPDDYVAKLARNFKKTGSDTAKLGDVYRGARDIEDIADRVKALKELVDAESQKDTTRLVGTIAAACDDILEIENINPQVRKGLGEVILKAAKWVELYGAFTYQTIELHACVVGNLKRLTEISKK